MTDLPRDVDTAEILRSDTTHEASTMSLNNSLETTSISDSIINCTNNTISVSASESIEFRNPLFFAIINARSVSAKIASLVDTFNNLELGFACISETWLRTSPSLDVNLADLEESHSISLIVRNRNGRGRGGGVGIAYNSRKLKLKRFPIKTRFEFVCASGKSTCNKRPIFIVSYYVPPDMKSEEFAAMMGEIEDAIGTARIKLRDPMIFAAGDSNRREISRCHEDFFDIQNMPCPPSRGNAELLTLSTNMGALVTDISANDELEDMEGQKTDHKTITVRMDLPRQDVFRKKKIKYRPYKKEGEELFGRLLLATDWQAILTESSTISVDLFTATLDAYTDRCFPMKEMTIKSSDLPWASRRFKRKVRQRNRCFRETGKTRRWRKLKEEAAEILQEEQVAYVERIKGRGVKDGSSKAFFKLVKTLKHRDAPTTWEIQSMFPGINDKEIAERVAEYFNQISTEYAPIPAASRAESALFQTPEPYQIAARLKHMKKPKGKLRGDIDPRLNEKYSDLLALPLAEIYKRVSITAEWPLLWKAEQVTVIPKNQCPSELSELRNLSCTPLYSKLLESFVLEDLKKTIRLSPSQYGGLKGCGVDHFLVDTWNSVLSHLEDGRAAANLISIDFEKAFNRMDHNYCVGELRKKGASIGAIGMVNAFLHGRTMSVRVGESFSDPRPVPGGSPQGSILANFLFCCTTDSMSTQDVGVNHTRDDNHEEEPALPIRPAVPLPVGFEVTASTPIRERVPPDQNDSSDDSSLDDTIRFFRNRRPFELDSSAEASFMMNQSGIDRFLGIPDRWTEEEVEIRCYIDDFTTIEKVKVVGSVSHITTGTCKTLVHANKGQAVFMNTGALARERNMKVNGKKTQMLCISGHSHEVKSYINIGDGKKIVSGDTMKILGFTFGTRPTAQAHINVLLPKMRRRLWMLTHLQSAGMGRTDLANVFFSVIRPVADFACVAYHSLLSEKQSAAIEKIQLRAFKTIYGPHVSYATVLKEMGFQTMKERRLELLEKFAIKTSQNERFSERWLPKNYAVDYPLRARQKYQEFLPRTERMKRNPIYAMRKILNELN